MRCACTRCSWALDQVKPWQTSGIQGVRRFLDRVWAIANSPLGDTTDDETERAMHKTIRKVTRDIEQLHLNTAVSTLMIFARHLGEKKPAPRSAVRALVLLLSPFAPHISEELCNGLATPSRWPTSRAGVPGKSSARTMKSRCGSGERTSARRVKIAATRPKPRPSGGRSGAERARLRR